MEWLDWIPDLATLEAVMLGLLLGPVLVLGVPVLLAVVRVPRRLAFETVSDAELDDAQRHWFEAVDAGFARLGLQPCATFRTPNLPTANLSRAFCGGADATVGIAISLSDANEASVLAENVVQLATEFADGGVVETRSATVTDLFDVPPGCERHVHRGTRDPERLFAHHRRHCGPHLVRGPVHRGPDEVFPALQSFHARWIAHQIARGLLRERDAESCGATLRLALRGIVSFYDPFGDRFSVPRFVLGLLAGLAPPLLLATGLWLDAEPLRRATLVLAELGLAPLTAEIAVLAPAFLASAAALGWIFESRAVVWAPLLLCVAGWLALPASTDETAARALWLALLLAAPALSQIVSNLRHRRAALA